MRILEKTFNQSVKKSLILNYKFDKFLFDLEKSTNQTFYHIIFKLSDLNNVLFNERKAESIIFQEKHLSYISEISYNDSVIKGIKNHKKNVDMGKWLGKELLYLFRSKYNYLNFDYE